MPSVPPTAESMPCLRPEQAAVQATATRCPLCGGDNHCAVQAARSVGAAPGPCWCMRVGVPQSLRARIPPEARGRTCICEGCVQAAQGTQSR